MNLEGFIFLFAALVAIGGALMMILQRNPVASVLYMVVSLVAQAILYVQLSALFVGAILIIVYTGAILVLFLFVIMLLNLRGEKFKESSSKLGLGTKVLFGLIFFGEAIAVILQFFGTRTGLPNDVPESITEFGSVDMVAGRLFREFLYPFELTSILLLVAIVGAVVIAMKSKGDKETGGEE